VRVPKFDRTELVVFGVTLGPILLLALIAAALDAPWWLIPPVVVGMFVWLIRYERWYQRRHPTQPPEAQGAGQLS
jgi:hypothetical protein